MARLPKIRAWAQTTEELLKMFGYTDSVFGNVGHCSRVMDWLRG